MRTSGNGLGTSPSAAAMRKLLRKSEQPSALLVELLSEQLAAKHSREELE